jgi:hypothetical protein
MSIVGSGKALADLSAQPPDAHVKVIVRPVDRKAGLDVTNINPRQFDSALAYRTALIAGRKESSRPGKELVVNAARELGLDASAAGVLNAVLVSGSAGSILRLLDGINYESVNLDQSI